MSQGPYPPGYEPDDPPGAGVGRGSARVPQPDRGGPQGRDGSSGYPAPQYAGPEAPQDPHGQYRRPQPPQYGGEAPGGYGGQQPSGGDGAPPSRGRRGLIIGVAVGVIVVLALGAVGVFYFLSSGSSNSFAVNSCVRKARDKAESVSCSTAGSFRVVSKVNTPTQCPDQ